MIFSEQEIELRIESLKIEIGEQAKKLKQKYCGKKPLGKQIANIKRKLETHDTNKLERQLSQAHKYENKLKCIEIGKIKQEEYNQMTFDSVGTINYMKLIKEMLEDLRQIANTIKNSNDEIIIAIEDTRSTLVDVGEDDIFDITYEAEEKNRKFIQSRIQIEEIIENVVKRINGSTRHIDEVLVIMNNIEQELIKLKYEIIDIFIAFDKAHDLMRKSDFKDEDENYDYDYEYGI